MSDKSAYGRGSALSVALYLTTTEKGRKIPKGQSDS